MGLDLGYTMYIVGSSPAHDLCHMSSLTCSLSLECCVTKKKLQETKKKLEYCLNKEEITK